VNLAIPNPWVDLPERPPFVAPIDADLVERLSSRLKGDYQLRLDLRPQPWTGDINLAEVFVLALNPGFAEQDYADLADSDYSEQWRLALTFGTRTPFYLLDPAFRATSGSLWWRRRFRDLIEEVGIEAVSRKIICVEHFPYKSVKYAPLGIDLPTQRYSFEIVREAVRQGKPVVIMRSHRIWFDSVQELRAYPYIRLSNNRSPHLNRTQMTAAQFTRLCEVLRGWSATPSGPPPDQTTTS
jgi:hypothetical protein